MAGRNRLRLRHAMKTSDASGIIPSFSIQQSIALVLLLTFACAPMSRAADERPPAGFMSLFNGRDFTGWKVPEGDNGHWKIVDGVIDYDAASESPSDKNLWTEREYTDFVLRVDWRI